MATTSHDLPINVEDFRLEPSHAIQSSDTLNAKQSRRVSGKFIRGPIPLDWVIKAGRLKGKALQVGMILWFESGCAGSRTVPLRQSLARRFGCHHDTIIRAVRELEKAGLITVDNIPGRCLSVTLIVEEEASTP